MPPVGAAIAAVGVAISGTVAAVSAYAASSFIASMIVNTATSVGVSLIARALTPKPKIKQSGIQTSVTTTGGTATAGHHVCPPMSHNHGDTPNGFLTYVIELSNLPGIGLRPFNCLGCLFVWTVGCFRFGIKMEVNMHWRITIEAVDPTGEEYRKEFLVEKNLDELTDGRIGFSIDDGKTVMAEIQKAVVQRELDLWVRYRRVCQSCGGQLPIKDYQKRSIITVFGSVPVTYPRLILCQKCNPWTNFTFSPAADLCPDRATPELMELSARLGAKLSFREASDILATFLPCHLSRKFTTLRHRAIAIGKLIEKAERKRLWHEHLDYTDRPQLELPLEGDLAREGVFTIDTAYIPLVRHWGGRTFEAVVGHCGRGGRGGSAGPLFAFEGTHPAELKATAALALKEQAYAGRGEITVISDGAECLKRLAGMLPQPAIHILDWFHISMKIQPLAQIVLTAPERHLCFEQDIDRIKWRIWNGQPRRALALISSVRKQLSSEIDHCVWAMRADRLLEKLQTYISRNRSSIVNYAERYRAGQRIATSPAEASVNTLVAKRFVKKQQMRWSRTGAHYLLKVRAAMLNGDLSSKTRYEPTAAMDNSQMTTIAQPTAPLLQAA